MAKKQEEDEAGPGAPEWIVTFSDMISLLVTFFVLLMTFSSMDTEEVLKLTSWLEATDGIQERGQGELIREAPPVDQHDAVDPLRGHNQAHSRPSEELQENSEAMGQAQTPDHQAFDLKDVGPGGLLLQFDERSAFAPGLAEMPQELLDGLAEIARAVENYPLRVVVEGHADGQFNGNALYPDADSVAMARAMAAAQAMLSGSRLDPQVVQVSSHGARRPRSSNDTAVGRRENRRVEVRLVPLSPLQERAHHERRRTLRDPLGG